MSDLYDLIRISLAGDQLIDQRQFDSQREACQWHIEAWKHRITSNALVLRGPDGRRYCFNDSAEVVGV